MIDEQAETGGAMPPLYIFDLDGTLSLADHRRHLLASTPPDWPGFYKAAINDPPNRPVVATLRALVRAGADVWVWSGRSDEVAGDALAWLHLHAGIPFDRRRARGKCWLRMRPAKDYTPDDDLKARWLAEMGTQDRDRLVAIFDDRDKVVAMWRARGLTVFQVAPGPF